jgi:hypothetical protein
MPDSAHARCMRAIKVKGSIMSKTIKRNPFGKREPGRVRRAERRAMKAAKMAFILSPSR